MRGFVGPVDTHTHTRTQLNQIHTLRIYRRFPACAAMYQQETQVKVIRVLEYALRVSHQSAAAVVYQPAEAVTLAVPMCVLCARTRTAPPVCHMCVRSSCVRIFYALCGSTTILLHTMRTCALRNDDETFPYLLDQRAAAERAEIC